MCPVCTHSRPYGRSNGVGWPGPLACPGGGAARGRSGNDAERSGHAFPAPPVASRAGQHVTLRCPRHPTHPRANGIPPVCPGGKVVRGGGLSLARGTGRQVPWPPDASRPGQQAVTASRVEGTKFPSSGRNPRRSNSLLSLRTGGMLPEPMPGPPPSKQ
jgi:hypothetical protein